ncbi:ABC transporter ATP-binding protein [bacterium]|nr:ABC transporter ATP-binding protein [bacterium]
MGSEQVIVAVPQKSASPNSSPTKRFWNHPLFGLIWTSAKVDIVAGLLLSPLHAATEVALGFVSGALLQLVFTAASDNALPRVLPGALVGLFNELGTLSRDQLSTIVPLLLVVIGFLRLLTSFGSNYLLERAGHRVAHALRSTFLDSYLHASGKILDTRNPDELTNKILLDTTLMQGLVSKGTIGALRDGLVVIGAAASMLVVASRFFLAVILILVPFFLVLRAISRRLEFYTRESARRQVELATRGLQMRQGLLAIYGMGAQQREKSDLAFLSNDFYRFMRKTLLLRTIFRPGMEIVAIVVLTVAVQWRLNLKADVDVAGYASIFVLAALSFRPLKNVSSFVSQFAELKAVWNRLVQEWDMTHLAQPNMLSGSASASEIPRPGVALDLRDVGYVSLGGQRILHPCRLVIRERSRVALVGESGAGKSTLLRLMAGLLPPDEGRIMGVPNTLLATQTPYVFQGSVFENIVYPDLPRKNPELQLARERTIALVLNLLLAHTHSGAELFLNKKVGFMGDGLSGGEKARVALARLLFADRSVLLLDEPTANLDGESAASFWQAVWKWQQAPGQTRTVVAVTHHLNDLDQFDECHLFANGKLICSGSVDEVRAAQQSMRVRGESETVNEPELVPV